MFYQFIRWYFGWIAKLYFRKVYTKGTENVPYGKPVIYASNHPAGFIEPIVLTTNVKQAIHFLVLGSFLKSKWLQWFFNGLKMVPIFRRDIVGNQSIEKNKSTFEYVYNALQDDSHILIYPEAKTHFTYKVRPLKKGIARMARGFLQRGSHKEMYIVPVGVNFNFPAGFRSDIFMQVGEPIRISSTEGEEAAWLRKVVNLTAEAMKKLVFDVEDESRHSFVQDLVEIKHYDKENILKLFSKPYVKNPDHVQFVRDYVSELDKMGDEDFDKLKSKLIAYKKLRKDKGLDERSIANKSKIKFGHYLMLLLGFPFYILGLILNGFSLLGGIWAKKKLVKRLEYKAGVASAVPIVLTFIIFVFCIVFAFIFHIGFILLAFLFPLSFLFLIFYQDFADLVLLKLKIRFLAKKETEVLYDLRKQILK